MFNIIRWFTGRSTKPVAPTHPEVHICVIGVLFDNHGSLGVRIVHGTENTILEAPWHFNNQVHVPHTIYGTPQSISDYLNKHIKDVPVHMLAQVTQCDILVSCV